MAVAFCLACFVGCWPRSSKPLRLRIEDPFAAVGVGRFDSLREAVAKDPSVVTETRSGDRTLLHRAAGCGYPEMVEFLIRAGAEVDAREVSGETPLHYAALQGQFAAAKVLIEHGADVTARAKFGGVPGDGKSVLSDAAGGGNLELVKLLLEKGAPVRYGEGLRAHTALHSAGMGNEKGELFDLLAKLVGDVNARNGLRRTPLHIAAELGNWRLVRHVLTHYPEADLDAQDVALDTPLHRAATKWWSDAYDGNKGSVARAEVIRLLLAHGARTDLRNKKGRTPREQAAYYSDPTLVAAFDTPAVRSPVEAPR